MPNINKGFTLVELLVSIAIIGAVILVAIPNFRQLSRDEVLINATTELLSALRQTQANAQTGIRCAAQDQPANSWRITIGSNSYALDALCVSGLDVPQWFIQRPNTTLGSVIITAYCTDNPGVPIAGPYVIFTSITFSDIGLVTPCTSQNAIFLTKITSTATNKISCIKVEKGGAIIETNPTVCP